jgi:hypothetical protein
MDADSRVGIRVYLGSFAAMGSDRLRMFRLIQSDFAAAGKLDGGHYAPPLLVNLGAFYFLGFERFDGCRQIVAHEVELCVEEFIPA